nr:hypothetical protein C01B7.2 - Caenorhabditis elegans [Caenorhabditis elegans]
MAVGSVPPMSSSSSSSRWDGCCQQTQPSLRVRASDVSSGFFLFFLFSSSRSVSACRFAILPAHKTSSTGATPLSFLVTSSSPSSSPRYQFLLLLLPDALYEHSFIHLLLFRILSFSHFSFSVPTLLIVAFLLHETRRVIVNTRSPDEHQRRGQRDYTERKSIKFSRPVRRF